MIIKLTVDRFEEDKAVLLTENQKIIIWPKSELPSKTRPGQIITMKILDNEQESKEQKQLAKAILNEILNTGQKKD